MLVLWLAVYAIVYLILAAVLPPGDNPMAHIRNMLIAAVATVGAMWLWFEVRR